MAIETRPALIPAGLVNGKLSPCQLAPVFFPGVGMIGVYPAAKRAWDMFAAVCHADTGLKLTITSAADAYRSYDRQVAAFNKRMSPSYNPLTCTTTTRTWNGTKYWLRRGFAPVATPGTSNHGFGIAFDIAWYIGGKQVGIQSSTAGWQWIVKNAVLFGFSWEGALPPSTMFEPWHIRHLFGDDVSPLVKDCEASFTTV